MSLKKFFLSVTTALLVTVGVSVSGASAAEMDQNVEKMTPEQIDKINAALKEVTAEANEQLAEGETNVDVKTSVANGSIELNIDVNPSNNQVSSRSVSVMAVQSKSYTAIVKYVYPGAGFEHKVSGKFTYEKGKLKGNSYDVYLTGPLYSKSHSTKVEKLDPSVWEVRSNGKFTALKFTPFEYTTRIVVGLYGSGTFRVLASELN